MKPIEENSRCATCGQNNNSLEICPLTHKPICGLCQDSDCGIDRDCKECLKKARNARRSQARRVRDEVYRSLGLKKVLGALGGTYWE